MEKKVRVGIVGGAGYTGGEAIRLLLNHPHAELVFAQSSSNAGNLLSDVHGDLVGDTLQRFSSELNPEIDLLMLCLGHGDSRKFLENNPIPGEVKIIDLSQDFRLEENSHFGQRRFVYGLPEMNLDRIRQADSIANPGCFATCLQLGLLPLAAAGELNAEVHVSAATGSTGAGQKLAPTSHFSWRASNLSVYKTFDHQHLAEIGQSLRIVSPSPEQFDARINFIPYRGDFTRGIFASIYCNSRLTLDQAVQLYGEYYRHAPFTVVTDRTINLKQVVNTNKCLLHLEKFEDKLLITAVIDNLLKGASGQAVENMNIMFGLDRRAGLRLKASAF